MDANQLEILIKVKEDLAGLEKTQNELQNLKTAATAGGGAMDGLTGSMNKTGASTLQLQRAGSALSSVLQGNVVGAMGAVRGATTAMLGPIGLAMAAVTAIVAKAQSMWQEQKAAEAARAADDYAWSLARASDNAEDLAKKSTDAFAAAITNARKYYEETSKALEQQFQSMEKIGRAKLALEITKVRQDSSLTAQEKILKEQQLIAQFETASLQEKEKLLNDQKALAEQAKANADREKEAAQLALEAAKAKTSQKDWINADEIKRLEDLKTQLKADITNNNATGGDVTYDTSSRSMRTVRSKDQIDRDKALNEQLAQVELQLKHEQDAATIEERRKDTIAGLSANFAAATDNANKADTSLASISSHIEQFNNTEKPVAAINAQTEAAKTSAQASAAGAKADQERIAAVNRLASIQEKMQLDQLRFERDQANSNPDLTKAQRQDIINGLLAKERDLLAEMVARRKQLLALETDPLKRAQIEAEIQALNNKETVTGAGAPPKQRAITQRVSNYEEANDGSQLTATEGPIAGLLDASDQLGTAGEGIADIFSGTIMDAVSAVTDGITGLIDGTKTWGEALRDIGSTIINTVIQAIVKMFVTWITQKLIMAALDAVLGKKAKAQSQENATMNAVEGGTKALAQMGPWGAVAFAAALAVVMIAAMALTSAFADGGPVTGKKQLAWLNDGPDGPEFVMRGAARAKYGDAMLSQINAGTFDPSAYATQALATAPIASTTTPAAALAQARGNAPASSAQTAAQSLAAAMPEQQPPRVNIAQFSTRNDARDWLQSQEGHKHLIDTTADNRAEMGIAT